MLISSQIASVVLDVDAYLFEFGCEFARKRVMHLEFAQTSLAAHPCDFFVQACDIVLAGHPCRTAQRFKLRIVRIQLSQGSVCVGMKQ